jgi:hypothetical protein
VAAPITAATPLETPSATKVTIYHCRTRPVEADRADVCPTKQTVTPLAIVDFALGAGVRL